MNVEDFLSIFCSQHEWFECPKTWWTLLKKFLEVFGVETKEELNVHGQQGRQTVETSAGYLLITWYMMPSGRYELIVYLTSGGK